MSIGPVVLSFHAVDNAAEEGVIADAAVLSELGCRPACVATSVLAAGSGAVHALQPLSLGLVAQQLESALGAGRPAAVRTGILLDEKQVRLVSDLLAEYRLPAPVVAPVPRIGSHRVLSPATLAATRERLFGLARVLVVRAFDLPIVVGHRADGVEELHEAAGELRREGARAVLLAGAVWHGRVLDLLDDEGQVSVFDAPRVAAPRVGGLSGAHAAALAAHLALGHDLGRSADAAQRYVGFRLQRGV